MNRCNNDDLSIISTSIHLIMGFIENENVSIILKYIKFIGKN
jgi:hypothetical protein